MRRRIFLILIFPLLLANFVFANTDSLRTQNGWRAISFPFAEIVSYSVMFDSANGWAYSDDKKNLFRLKDNHWQTISLPDRYQYVELFGFAPGNIWVGCYDKILYRYFLRRFDGKNWHNIYPPNTDRIRDLQYLSENNIWGVCEWGEIIHYNGKKWELVPTSTFFHLDHIFMQCDTSGWIWSEHRYGKSFLFQRKKNVWEPKEIEHDQHIEPAKVLYPVIEIEVLKNDSLLIYEKEIWNSPYLSSLVSDTVFINCAGSENPLFYHKNGTVLTKGGAYIFNDSKTYQFEILYMPDPDYRTFAYMIRNDGSVSYVKILSLAPKSNTFASTYGMSYFNEYGIVFVDVNNDGLEDIFSIDTNRENRLHLATVDTKNQPNLNLVFSDAAEKFNLIGVSRGEKGNFIFDMGATAADMDNDGDRDIYITSLYDHNMLYKNVRGKTFREIADRARVTTGRTRSNVGIWGDVNNDGDVDLFVTNEDTTNMLFLNNGNRRFKDVTSMSGLTSTRGGKGATFGDLDSDGDLDLVVPNYSLANRIYRNEGIHPETRLPFFKDVTEEWLPPGADSLAKSASACLADYDNDGDLDLYIANLVFSSRLYENDGSGHFSDVTEAAGLLDSSLCHSPCFFDADNDGDLDLFVSNRGRNLFFKNLGNKKFIRDEISIDLEPDAYSNGLACGDPDNDGDLDCYLANNDKNSFYYTNLQNNNNFLEIKLVGTKSNSDAIGAKAYLYHAGFLGQKSHLTGFREINGGYGFGSMNSTTIHFGADSSKKYDLKIWFPSGIEIIRTNLYPGQILTIEEQTGMAKWVSTAKRTLLRYAKSPIYQHKFLEFLVLFVSFVLTLKFLVRQGLFESRLQKYALVFPLFIYLFISFILFESNYIKAHLMPLSVSIFIFTATIFLNKQRTIKINRERLAEQLLLSCKIFDHGSWATTSLNQLQLFSVNLPPNETIGENASQKLTETITGFYHLVYKEIDHIAQLATEAQIKSHQGAEISRQLLFLSENLNKIKVALAMQKGVGAEIWNNVYRLTDQIRLNIREINFSAISFFSCDVFEILRNVTTNFQEQGNNFIVLNQSILMETEMRICIKPGELAPIIENLVDNAIRATRDVSKPKIKIQYRQTDQYLFLEITDNGIGIPPKIQETIFEENFSTKKEHSSGFGLFFSRLTLEKYRGSIEVIKSSKNKGTTFLVKLKRI